MKWKGIGNLDMFRNVREAFTPHFDTSRLDWWEAWSWFVGAWVLIFGFCSFFAMILCKEFAYVHWAPWLAFVVGVPVATFFSGIIFIVATFLLWMRGRKEIFDTEAESKKNNRSIHIACVTGCIATVAALFSHITALGPCSDFSVINIFDAIITAGLTYGLYRRQMVPAFLLFLYFVLWKMPLWSELQPKSLIFAGMGMAFIFWRGVLGIARDRSLFKKIEFKDWD